MSRYHYGFPEYVSVAQKRAKAMSKLKSLKKKSPGIQPVVIEGRSIAATWWGKSWNKNLERYADYSNRIGRGRSYVRHGAVLDLQIKPGKIHALVQGSGATPYKIEVSIAKLDKKTWQAVRKSAGDQLDSLADLLAGRFPPSLQTLFFAQNGGLFPSPKEISFDCSCPDWASMCKHVAATLYGVGARLDQSPRLFFELRRIEVDELIAEAIKSTSRALIKKAKSKSSRVMEGADLSDVFGIALDEGGKAGDQNKGRKKAAAKGAGQKKKRSAAGLVKVPVATKGAGQKGQRSAAGSAKASVIAKGAQRVVKKKASAKKPEGTVRQKKAASVAPKGKPAASTPRQRTVTAVERGTFVDQVVAAIGKRRKEVSIAEMGAGLELSDRQVRNAVARAVAQGRLRKVGRGGYCRA